MGCAIADYWENGKAEELRVFSPMFEEDTIPVTTLFRSYDEMPETERCAIDMAAGRTLDVGAGAGCHSLALQDRGIDVTAIDISQLSVETMRKRGVQNAVCQDFFTLGGEYDTILMLMNGIGIVGTINRLPLFFSHIDKIMATDGQLFCDSSDISYVFEDEDGIVEYPDNDGYYGELTYQMQYKDVVGNSFPWLYIDAETLAAVADAHGFKAEVIKEGEHYDYLMRIRRKD